MTTRTLLLASCLLSAGGMLLGPAAASAAATSDRLTFDAASGLDITRIRLIVPEPCPAKTTNIVATATGSGMPRDGQVVVTNSDIDYSRSAPFAVAMSDTMAGFAAVNGATLHGRYQVTLSCIDPTTTITYAQYRGTVTFADAHHWTAPRAPEALRRAVDRGSLSGLGTALPHSPGASPSPGGTAAPGGGAPGGGAAGPGTAAGAVTGTAARHAQGGQGMSPLLGLGLGVAGTGLVALALSSWRQERQARKGVPA